MMTFPSDLSYPPGSLIHQLFQMVQGNLAAEDQSAMSLADVIVQDLDLSNDALGFIDQALQTLVQKGDAQA